MSKTSNGAPADIAIVGMSCLFPGSDGPAEFWSTICRGLEQIRDPLPAWDPARYLNGTDITTIPTARGGFLGEAFAADPISLGVMPSSLDGSEPDHFLALRIAQAALADALGGRDFDPIRTGIILGHSTYLHRGNAAVVQHGVVLDQTRALLGQLMPDADPAVLDRVRAAMARQLPPFNSDTAPCRVPNVVTGRTADRPAPRGPTYPIDAARAPPRNRETVNAAFRSSVRFTTRPATAKGAPARGGQGRTVTPFTKTSSSPASGATRTNWSWALG